MKKISAWLEKVRSNRSVSPFTTREQSKRTILKITKVRKYSKKKEKMKVDSYDFLEKIKCFEGSNMANIRFANKISSQ
jgi:hypothetical protein